MSPAPDDGGAGGGDEHTVGHVPHLLTHSTFVSGPGVAGVTAASPMDHTDDTIADASSARQSALPPSIADHTELLFASGNENEIPAPPLCVCTELARFIKQDRANLLEQCIVDVPSLKMKLPGNMCELREWGVVCTRRL